MLRVEIGPGNIPEDTEGCFVDCRERTPHTRAAVWGQDPLPFGDAEVDAIFGSHVIEHVPWFMVDYALSEAFRVLKPGGTIELWSPDFKQIVAAYLAGAIPTEDTWRRFNPSGDFMRWVNAKLFAYFDKLDDIGYEQLHKSAHDYESLSRALSDAGFTGVQSAARPVGYSAHGPAEFGITAVRPLN